MEVVSDADEAETLLEEFADAGSAEEEQPENHVILVCGSNQVLGGFAEFRRSVHLRELVLFEQTHGHAKIVLAEEQNINAGNGCDFFDVLDAIGGFDLQSADGVIVP